MLGLSPGAGCEGAHPRVAGHGHVCREQGQAWQGRV